MADAPGHPRVHRRERGSTARRRLRVRHLRPPGQYRAGDRHPRRGGSRRLRRGAWPATTSTRRTRPGTRSSRTYASTCKRPSTTRAPSPPPVTSPRSSASEAAQDPPGDQPVFWRPAATPLTASSSSRCSCSRRAASSGVLGRPVTARRGERPELGERPQLEMGQRVHVRVAQCHRPGQHEPVGQQPVVARSPPAPAAGSGRTRPAPGRPGRHGRPGPGAGPRSAGRSWPGSSPRRRTARPAAAIPGRPPGPRPARRDRPAAAASPLPRPYQPGRFSRVCAQENTHGIARRSSSPTTPTPRRAGRDPIRSPLISSNGLIRASHSAKPWRLHQLPVSPQRGRLHLVGHRPVAPGRGRVALADHG